MASSDARVEMTFCLDDQLYALEHTGIEPFDGFMKLQNTASQRVEPFRADITRGLSSHLAVGQRSTAAAKHARANRKSFTPARCS